MLNGKVVFGGNSASGTYTQGYEIIATGCNPLTATWSDTIPLEERIDITQYNIIT